MTTEETKAIASLRDAGYAVTVFNPEELQGADAGKVADRLVELGWDVIDCFKGD